MAVRSSMADLITRTRERVGDTGGSPTFTDQQVQDALDANRIFVRYTELRAEPTYTAGATLYKDFFSDHGDWETDVVLVDSAYATLAPTTSDLIAGHWTFNATQSLGVYVIGQTYDIAAAAVKLARDWVAKLKGEYDFSTAGDSFSRSQKIANLKDLIAQLQQETRAVVVSSERWDTGG